jgi:hypothetical protein
MAKRNREHAVEEKRRLKREKKQAAAAARNDPDALINQQAVPAAPEETEPTVEPIDVR